ncbi:MAG TPA: hypothetical protein VHX65_04175 [Pirellulales bacterium]|jgi:hypothetical protein|nr:hypothetical protein [Pirellulales bacterium]
MAENQSNTPPSTTPAAAGAPPATAASQAADAPPSPEILKAALKAFKKRMKFTQLDDESRVGHGPMSGGQKSSITAITPPNQYPRAVWDELVKQGKLKSASHGMYSLA